MNRHYSDILSRISELPDWFDEHAVPRWGECTPYMSANIYANEVVLMQIACQGCGRPFHVALSKDRFASEEMSLADLIRLKEIHYGDPPNVDCCDSGPTMNSEPHTIIRYWHKHDFLWVRDLSLEIDVQPSWVKSKEI